MAGEQYPAGASVDLYADVKVGGTLTSPSAPTCRVRRPKTGEVVTLPASIVSVGRLKATFDHVAGVDPTGDHYYRFDGASPARGGGEDVFTIRDSEVLD